MEGGGLGVLVGGMVLCVREEEGGVGGWGIGGELGDA